MFMRITWVTFGLGWLAILGVPPFSGFWSKDSIIESAFVGEGWEPWVLGGAALIGAGITAFYMTPPVLHDLPRRRSAGRRTPTRTSRPAR